MAASSSPRSGSPPTRPARAPPRRHGRRHLRGPPRPRRRRSPAPPRRLPHPRHRTRPRDPQRLRRHRHGARRTSSAPPRLAHNPDFEALGTLVLALEKIASIELREATERHQRRPRFLPRGAPHHRRAHPSRGRHRRPLGPTPTLCPPSGPTAKASPRSSSTSSATAPTPSRDTRLPKPHLPGHRDPHHVCVAVPTTAPASPTPNSSSAPSNRTLAAPASASASPARSCAPSTASSTTSPHPPAPPSSSNSQGPPTSRPDPLL